MGAEIDRLEVQIEAEATKANSQLDSLVKKLDIVQESLSRLNSGGLTGMASGSRKSAGHERLSEKVCGRSGHIVEQGTHDGLLLQNGSYAQMWRDQAGQYIEAQ